MSPEQFEYLNQNLNTMLSVIRDAINTAQDRPDQVELPAQQVVTRVLTGRRGRPRIEINQQYLAGALDLRNPAHIAPIIEASRRTIFRRAVDYGIRPPGQPVAIRVADENGQIQTRYLGRQSRCTMSNDEIDMLMRRTLTLFPNFGREMLSGYFRGLGHTIPRQRVRESFDRVNGPGAEIGRRRIQRRVYKVAGPNSLWHHDGHHSTSFSAQNFVLLKPKVRTNSVEDRYPLFRRWIFQTGPRDSVCGQQPS
jgi:hypothetical protein